MYKLIIPHRAIKKADKDTSYITVSLSATFFIQNSFLAITVITKFA